MLSRADRDVVALTVLGLLTMGPKHTYEMHRLMIDTHKDFVTGLPRSMYHAVEKLQRDGLIEVVGTLRDGPRPERTVYALTGAGRAALKDRVGRLLRTPDADSTLFVAALTFMACLPVPDVRAALDERAATLHAAATAAAKALEEIQAPRLLLIELEYQLARDRAEKAWVDRIVADLVSGRLAWPDDPTEFIAQLP
ncbi:PadR family transcriptional regulator [Kutzneria buriramensis]|uniref:DNA-binding PadR family transcriptional regulator n=1 Tax=Kutzneria buriramensis TaxID=1045776 RepID=A0A3E0HP17_9PSEU|nr:PadR family transcriptional regulator [Kutzneria buriramensis]REH48262.1 DNA-binding PadR family transcriptional regulator [Kutzneria buriramensis]